MKSGVIMHETGATKGKYYLLLNIVQQPATAAAGSIIDMTLSAFAFFFLHRNLCVCARQILPRYAKKTNVI